MSYFILTFLLFVNFDCTLHGIKWGKRADFSAILYLSFCCFCSKEFSLSPSAWDR